MANLVMNVTAEEFSNIRQASDDLQPADFAKFMREFYGCQPWDSCELRVHWNRNPGTIPWLSEGLMRFQPKEVPDWAKLMTKSPILPVNRGAHE